MKRLLTGAWIGAIALACTATLGAQAPANRAAIEKTLMEQEQKVKTAFEKGDAAGMKMFIADDATVTDDSGIQSVSEFFKMMPTMQIKVTDQKLADFKFLWVDATTAVATYTWTGKGTVMGQAVKSPTYASTVWAKRGEKWLAVYHQETAAGTMPMAMPMKK
jgi:ketosteroid isomerase-like protein